MAEPIPLCYRTVRRRAKNIGVWSVSGAHARSNGLESKLDGFPLIAMILAIAAAVRLVATKPRKSMTVAFIGVGALIGPTGTAERTATPEPEPIRSS
jgi:hypothetical protein